MPGVHKIVFPDVLLGERFVEIVRSEVDISDFPG